MTKDDSYSYIIERYTNNDYEEVQVIAYMIYDDTEKTNYYKDITLSSIPQGFNILMSRSYCNHTMKRLLTEYYDVNGLLLMIKDHYHEKVTLVENRYCRRN